MLYSSEFLHLTAMELGYSREALPMLLQGTRAIPKKPPSENASPIPGWGLVTHSPKCHELAEQKDVFVDASYLCTGDFAGIGTMGVLFFSHSPLPG